MQSQGFLQREAERYAPMALLKQLRRTPSPPSPTAEDEEPAKARRSSVSSVASSSSSQNHGKVAVRPKSMTSHGSWKDPQVRRIII
jgi:hypothetical protein